LVRDECRDLLLQIAEKTQRIEQKTKQISTGSKSNIPGFVKDAQNG